MLFTVSLGTKIQVNKFNDLENETKELKEMST